jgi:hypothetical protein
MSDYADENDMRVMELEALVTDLEHQLDDSLSVNRRMDEQNAAAERREASYERWNAEMLAVQTRIADALEDIAGLIRHSPAGAG